MRRHISKTFVHTLKCTEYCRSAYLASRIETHDESAAVNNEGEECNDTSDNSSMLLVDHQSDDLVEDDNGAFFDDPPNTDDVRGPVVPLIEDWIVSVAGPRKDEEISLEELQSVFPANSKSPSFYKFESLHPMKGANFLTAIAFEQNPLDVSDEEAIFALKITQLVSGFSGREQQLFADILRDVCNSRNEETSIFKSTRPPSSMDDIQDFFVKGKNSIVRNLPQPIVSLSNDESHAYVNIVDVLANMMAQATTMERFDEQTTSVPDLDFDVTVSSTKAGLELYLELKEDLLASTDGSFTLFIWIREWSDDFDPSHTKSNRCQVWLKTFTFCPPASSTDDRNTAFIAIGSRGDDHEEIEDLLNGQLRQLGDMNGKKMYHGGLNRIIQVKAGIVATCVDRPERTKLFQIGDHNGTFSACWSFAAYVDGSRKENCLPSCPFCRHRRVLSYMSGGHQQQQQILESTSMVEDTSSIMATSTVSAAGAEDIDLLHGNDGAFNSSHSDFDSSCSANSHHDEFEESHARPHTAVLGSILSAGAAAAPIAPTVLGECPFGKCSSWNLFDATFSFPAPPKFPTLHDTRPEAPRAPPGREICPDILPKDRRLVSIYLTVQWLQEASLFAYHNYKTCPPGARPNKRFWRKENLEAYLRTCGIVKKLQQEIARCAQSNLPCPVPSLWTRKNDGLRRCHYAPMHMLFLGHMSNQTS